ncbi:uncharacterized protein LOC130801299 [Amaranthus tricolor]|uniref:uncharacterized protein LOC130801299 n=1 Tax=Amaranthus tricolor TaxID=29722 RepID=UPI0025848B57|nr:uncharacterized protein LOC130801299 [Amaranthus tricolor]
MVLGLRNKTRRGPSIQVDYLIHVQDIKPWPPTQSLKNVRSVLIQWENGERNSGSTSSVAPSIEDGKIVFNESFRLSATLSRDMSVKTGGDVDIFHKNLLELNLYEPRRDKTVKGQLLGTAIVDLADYGVVREVTSVSAPMNCTRSFRNTMQPILNLRIQAYDKVRSSSGVSLRGRLAKEASLDKNDAESVSALMSEEYADEAEVASFTDDDVSSHSSLNASSVLESNGASPSQNKENGSSRGKRHAEFSSNKGKPNDRSHSFSDSSELDSESNLENESSTSGQAHESSRQVLDEVASLKDQGLTISMSNEDPSIAKAKGSSKEAPGEHNFENDILVQSTRGSEKNSDDVEIKDGDMHKNNDRKIPVVEEHIVGNPPCDILPPDVNANHVLSESDSHIMRDRVRHVKSVRSMMDSSRSNSPSGGFSGSTLKQEMKTSGNRSYSSDGKTLGLEQKIKILERELREAAALEVSLYSVAAEHGSSTNKVHAPARRLSRLCLRAEEGMKRSSAAQSAISGLIIVAKACGNDVPRLTFWLSNCVVLRAIVSEAFTEEQLPVSASSSTERTRVGKGVNQKSSVLKWKLSSDTQANKNSIKGSFQDFDDPHAFVSALQKVESWIFSRIVESIWWQTLTPHMQPAAAQMIDKLVDSGISKKNRRSSSSGDHEQVNFSLELWKKAFKEACERLCPLRAGGHECGCLPVLAKLIMEQCVARLDVAMFNAILRESVDDIPTDPVSDPISDAKVLPVPAGKSSFGSGAQLKNAIGNWSRWLTDLFGIDDDDPLEEEREDDEDDSKGVKCDTFTSFHLLKSLSDLMMLPKDLLLSESIRREVCPTFGTQLIKRVLENFVPDEFCSDPIPDAVFEALDTENINNTEDEGLIINCPCTAPAVFYSPPLPSSLASAIGINSGTQSPSQLRRSGSVLRRSNTSDDELDELDSPLHAILSEDPYVLPEWKQKWKVVQNKQKFASRYQLLREVWDAES